MMYRLNIALITILLTMAYMWHNDYNRMIVAQNKLLTLQSEYNAIRHELHSTQNDYYEVIDINNEIARRYMELEDYTIDLYCLINYGNGESVSWVVRYGVEPLNPIGVDCK